MLCHFSDSSVRCLKREIQKLNPPFVLNHWPESSALDNATDFCLTALPMALPPKIFFLKIA